MTLTSWLSAHHFALDKTEESLGKAIRESSVPREKVFVTTKLWNTHHKPEHVRPACERSLKDLQFDYLDMYMLHWPMVILLLLRLHIFGQHDQINAIRLGNSMALSTINCSPETKTTISSALTSLSSKLGVKWRNSSRMVLYAPLVNINSRLHITCILMGLF